MGSGNKVFLCDDVDVMAKSEVPELPRVEGDKGEPSSSCSSAPTTLPYADSVVNSTESGYRPGHDELPVRDLDIGTTRCWPACTWVCNFDEFNQELGSCWFHRPNPHMWCRTRSAGSGIAAGQGLGRACEVQPF